jgi:AcrR family transcriptional regulator
LRHHFVIFFGELDLIKQSVKFETIPSRRYSSAMGENLKRKLLLAAYRVLGTRGASGLTLDAVAEEAGASKGGVLYHFRSKRALFEALLLDVVDECDRDLDRFLKDEEEGRPGRFVRAYIRSLCREETEEEQAMGSALLAAIAEDPTWAKVYWPAVERWRARAVEDGLDEATALALMAAADGMSLDSALGIGVGKRAVREEMVERLIEWSYPKGGVK